MDLQLSLDRFSGLGDVSPPREIEIETQNGIRGTISVPHAVDDDDFLMHGYEPPTRKIAIILHGQGGHRNYCYQRKLAHKLAAESGMYALRIDFRGCGLLAEVADPEKGRVLELDIEDIQEVARFVTDASLNPMHIRFELTALVGHSRGLLAMFMWAVEQQKLLKSPLTASDAIVVPNLINCSLRFRLVTVLDRYPVNDDDFFFLKQDALRHGKMQAVKVTRDELRSLSTADSSLVSSLSPQWSVLSIYGTEDTIIPKDDCAFFANALDRGAYTHHLELIEGADHNFYGVEPVESESDAAELNPHKLPLLKHGVVNYNHVVCAIVVKYLRSDQELLRFQARDQVPQSDGFARVKKVDGISNCRDVGGWEIINPTFGGENPDTRYFVRRGFLYRCANPARVTPQGLLDLKNLNVKAVYDLRSEDEISGDGIPQGLVKYGIQRYHTPVFRHEDYSPEAIALRFLSLITSWHTYVQIYEQILDGGAALFRQMFEHIRDRPEQPLLFHCTAGKDRTGVFAMLVLRLAGVDRFTVAKEYELTTLGLIPDHGAIKSKFVAGVLKLKDSLKGQMLEKMIVQGRENWTVEEDGFKNLISSRSEALLATMDLLDEKYGGVVSYMTENLGFSEADVRTIFDRIVEKRGSQPSQKDSSKGAKF